MTTDNYISFFDAKKILTANLGNEPSNEEFWLWCFFGKNIYGIEAYVSEEVYKKVPDKERLQLFREWHKVNIAGGWADFGSSLSVRARMAEHCFFLRADIEAFQPTTRYLTGNELLSRWLPMENSEDDVKQVIKEYASLMPEIGYIEGEPPYYLHNMYFDATATWENGLGGIYSLDEILAVETFRDMTEKQAEAVGDAGAGSHAMNGTRARVKARKKLKPLKRETNEGLLLLYEIFKHYKVEYLDDLPAHKAWGKIITNEFKSDSISNIAETKKHIMLSGGEKLLKTGFGDKYRRRFE